MAVNAVIGTYQKSQDETIFTGLHGPVFRTMAVKTNNGVLSAGLIVAQDAEGLLIPFEAKSVNIGSGDGSGTEFSGTIPGGRLAPGTVTVTAGTATLTDDGLGRLSGAGSGTVNYKTGAVSVSFDTAPTYDAPVVASAYLRPVGVLAERCDTTKESAAIVIVHGTVFRDKLAVLGKDSPAPVDIAILEASTGVFAD